eukprot:CAMPEP_0168241142 /NCGR_PEP_ID=MMETSP0140_2-20121125/22624_1 /TAXON_ID=44445 /ORGANISM="Pseudo-nitzschia australis, Strain 10249 10 AB" /LENGTH=92 /DNA_ID=CAMNT_0008175947 /DNA_START=739 /DNA_END=1013 /DNA_ORIENTATION=+
MPLPLPCVFGLGLRPATDDADDSDFTTDGRPGPGSFRFVGTYFLVMGLYENRLAREPVVLGLDLLVGVAPHAAAAGPRVDPVKEVPKGPKLG